MIPQAAVVMKNTKPVYAMQGLCWRNLLEKTFLPTESFSKAMWVKKHCLLRYSFPKKQVNMLVENIDYCHDVLLYLLESILKIRLKAVWCLT